MPIRTLFMRGVDFRGTGVSLGSPLAEWHDVVIRVYNAAGNVIKTHEHAGDFVEP